jgi:protein-L-isoaspartate(D-aspartate) O-methyltransferase
MDIERARFNMIESQIRTWEVLDQSVLDLLSVIKREAFVPEKYRPLAFVDMEIPLGHGEVMLAPKLEARLLQELTLGKTDRVLEIGTGSGYMTALLANLAEHVYSVELYPEFSAAAAAALRQHGIENATLEVGNGAQGWARHAPYDVILLTGSVPVMPPQFRAQLRPGGRLLAVVGDPPAMTATLVTCVTEGAYNETGLFETCIRPLQHAIQPERFVF